MGFKSILLFGIVGISVVCGQRSPYAGSRPGGYKDRFQTTVVAPAATGASTSTNNTGIGNRLGEPGTNASVGTTTGTTGTTGTTQRLPYDAYGDRFAVDHLSQLPQDKQPFWLINQQHIEAHRGGQPGVTQPSAATGNSNGQTVNDRFGDTDSVNPIIDRNSLNVISKQEIVYPVNVHVPQQRPSTSSTPANIAPVSNSQSSNIQASNAQVANLQQPEFQQEYSDFQDW